MILKSKTDLSDEQIAAMSDGEAWGLVYTLKPSKSRYQKAANQICFTGFSPIDKERLGQTAISHGFEVVTKVTKALAYLVSGANAGPSKCKQAREQEVVIMTEEQFAKFLCDGEIPQLAMVND
jgi:NAD-dependent DNA ligase